MSNNEELYQNLSRLFGKVVVKDDGTIAVETMLSFWTPENDGDSIEGEFHRWLKTDKGDAPVLMTDDGQVGLPNNVIITTFFNQIPLGSRVKVVYRGKPKTAKLYDFYLTLPNRRKE